jgi:proline iminopeptidase
MIGRWLKRLGLLLLVLLAVPLGVVGAVVAFFAAAYVISSIALLGLVGALALVLLTGGFSWLAARGIFAPSNRWRRWLPAAITSGTLLLAAVVSGLFVFQPMDVVYVPKEPTEQTRYWDLPNGSRLAYLLTPAEGVPRPTPVVILHGGPGGPGSFTPQQKDQYLAAAGFDVYRYDQVGAGLSNRLEEISEYTVARHVADLEYIRQAIGAEQMILVGSSWGGTLAAHYLAAHPDRVEQAVVSSPGAIWPPAFAEEGATTGPEDEIISEAATPRFAVVWALQQINPTAAHNLASDQEMSGFFQPLIGRVIASDVAGCDPEGEAIFPPAEPQIPRGLGYYANMMTVASMHRVDDPRPALERVEAPILILRGECDRLRPEVTHEYRDLFPNATLLVIDGASHSISGARPELYTDILQAFLLDQSLPLEPYQGEQ